MFLGQNSLLFHPQCVAESVVHTIKLHSAGMVRSFHSQQQRPAADSASQRASYPQHICKFKAPMFHRSAYGELSAECSPSSGLPSLVVKLNGLCARRSGHSACAGFSDSQGFK